MIQLPALYSQRDPQWSGDLLGFNTSVPYTIGNYGCLISCLGMLTGRTPHDINETIKAGNGFTQGGLFVWGKSGLVGLNQEYVSYAWTGPVTDAGIQTAKDYIAKGKPLLAEVDFNPATSNEEMHFVLVLEITNTDATIADPWTGTIRSMNEAYGGFKRGVCQFRVYDKVFTTGPVAGTALDQLQAELDKTRSERDHNWNLYQAEQQAKMTLEDQLANANKLIATRNAEITDLGQKVKDAAVTIYAQAKAIQDLKDANNAEALIALNTKRDLEKLQMDYDILKAQKTQNHKILTGWRAIVHDFLLQ